MYGLPLEAMIVIDQEAHTKLLACSVIPNKTSNSFKNFFKDYIELGGKTFRIIVVDRLQARLDALQVIFPNSYIIFCLVHIRRDLLLYFQTSDEIIIKFEDTIVNPSISYEYLNNLIQGVS